MSPKRVRSVTTSTVDTVVVLMGSPGEEVQFDVCRVDASGGYCDSSLDYCNSVRCQTVYCKINSGGTATLHALRSVCW